MVTKSQHIFQTSQSIENSETHSLNIEGTNLYNISEKERIGSMKSPLNVDPSLELHIDRDGILQRSTDGASNDENSEEIKIPVELIQTKTQKNFFLKKNQVYDAIETPTNVIDILTDIVGSNLINIGSTEFNSHGVVESYKAGKELVLDAIEPKIHSDITSADYDGTPEVQMPILRDKSTDSYNSIVNQSVKEKSAPFSTKYMAHTEVSPIKNSAGNDITKPSQKILPPSKSGGDGKLLIGITSSDTSKITGGEFLASGNGINAHVKNQQDIFSSKHELSTGSKEVLEFESIPTPEALKSTRDSVLSDETMLAGNSSFIDNDFPDIASCTAGSREREHILKIAKPIETQSMKSSSILPSDQNLKRKAPPIDSTNNKTIQSQGKDALFAELKAMKIASITARNAAIEADIASKRNRIQEITKELKAPAAETVKRHIKLLHEYNDIRDIGQGLIGMIAEQRGVRIGDLYEEFGVDLKD